MLRTILFLSLLPMAQAQAAEASGVPVAGILVVALLGVAVWLSMPAKRKSKTSRAARPRSSDQAAE